MLELAAEDGPADRGAGPADAKQTVGVAQTVRWPGKPRLDRHLGEAGTRVAEAELAWQRRELAREVHAAFLTALAAERIVEVADELVRVAEASAAAARKRVEAGAATDQERLRAEISLEQARAERVDLAREALAARQTLAAWLGRPDLGTAPLAGALAESADLTALEPDEKRELTAHPGLLAARAARNQAELEWRRARLEPYPDVTLGVAGGWEAAPERSAIVELRVSLPLPVFDRSAGRKREARARLDIADAEVTAVEQRLRRDWNLAVQRLRAATEQVARHRDHLLPRAEEALRLVRAGFEEGRFSLLDLLDTQRTLAGARLAYQRKLLELNLARTDLEALRGLPAFAAGWQTDTASPAGRP